MKRTLVGLATLAIAISSCTNNELIEGVQSPDNAIDYAPYVGRATRAASMTLENLNNFRVVAYGTQGTYADATEFTGNGYAEDVTLSADIWTGEETRYWPEDPELMSFFAYSPKDAGAFTAATAGGYPSLAFSVDATPASQVDLLGAVMMDQTRKSDNKNVAFNLKHLLTQVTFKAKAGSTAYTVKVKSIKISNVNPEGTFTYDGSATVGTWGTTSGTQADYTYVEYDDITANTEDTPAGDIIAKAVKGENLMLIPSAKGSLTGVEMEVVYQCYNKEGAALGEEITKKVTLTDQDEWAMGKKVSYVMLLHRQSGPIVFEAEIEDWADETPQDKEVNDIFNVKEIDLADGKSTTQKIEITNRAGVDAAFTLKSSEPWLKISANSDGSGALKDYVYTPITRAIAAKTTLYLVAEYNGTAATRAATLTWAREGADPVVLNVTQAAMSEDKPFGDVTTVSITDDTYSKGVAFTYTENRGAAHDYTLESSDSWLTISDQENNASSALQKYTYTVTGALEPSKTFYLYANDITVQERTATVTLKRTGMKDMTFTVTQEVTVEPYIIYGQAPCNEIGILAGATTSSYNGWAKNHTHYIIADMNSVKSQKPFSKLLVSRKEYMAGEGTPAIPAAVWGLSYDYCKKIQPAGQWRLQTASESLLIDVNRENLTNKFPLFDNTHTNLNTFKVSLSLITSTSYATVSEGNRVMERSVSGTSLYYGFRCVREMP